MRSTPDKPEPNRLACYASVIDALHALIGMKHIDMPATREKLWRALRAA